MSFAHSNHHCFTVDCASVSVKFAVAYIWSKTDKPISPTTIKSTAHVHLVATLSLAELDEFHSSWHTTQFAPAWILQTLSIS